MKKWYYSRTIWIGILEVIAGVALYMSDVLATGGVLTASGILKVILRLVTKQAVTR